MRELDYVVLDLDSESKKTCDFCSNFYGEDNKSIRQIISRVKDSDEYVSDDVVCEECEANYWNNQIPKCERCGRLQTKLDVDLLCRCIRRKENLEEKILPRLPHQRESMPAFYEKQIKSLQEQLNNAEWTIHEEREAHEDFMKTSEEWSKRQKGELLDKIKELERKIKQLEAENKRLKELTPQELINEVESYKKEVAQLKIQLEKSNSQQSAQIEVKNWPWLKIRK